MNECRAGFSWWGAWGPAIGVGDGGKGIAAPKKVPEKYFSGRQCKIGEFFGRMSCKIPEFC